MVYKVLKSDPRFVQVGKRRASRFDLASPVPTFDVHEAAAHFDCTVELATEFLFGEGGFLELGLVERLNGNGRLAVTELCLEMAAVVECCR